MNDAGHQASPQPHSLDGAEGRLFAVYYPPEAEADRGADLIYLPPFAEEMNRSRRMAALQARELAAIGVGVVILDLYGTGDSEGDFRDARWSLWQSDVKATADWLERRGRSARGLLGLRLGALLAVSVI